MLEYFPTNYVWNLSTNIALLMGGNYGEIDTICRQLVEVSKAGDDAGTVAFFNAWCGQADRLVELAQEDLHAGRRLSAGASMVGPPFTTSPRSACKAANSSRGGELIVRCSTPSPATSSLPG